MNPMSAPSSRPPSRLRARHRPQQADAFMPRALALACAAAFLAPVQAQEAGAVDAQPAEPVIDAPANAPAGRQPVTTEGIVIQGKRRSEADLAARRINAIAGGASVVRQADVERGRASTAEDVLALQPGVYARAAGGNDAIKISIRGSGINASPGYFREGTKFLFDGLALTGPGGTPYELLEMSGVDYTEVLRGANAFDYGALALGGAINFATQTGRSAPGFRARLEAGSFGWNKQQASYGGVAGDGAGGDGGEVDYFISLARSERQGFQEFTHADSRGLVANLGWRLTPRLQTRLYLRYREEYHENAATLTVAQLKADASQTTAAVRGTRADSYKPGSTWLANKTTYAIDDASRLEFGLVWHDYPQSLSKDSLVNPNHWLWRDVNTSLRYLRTDDIAGRRSDTTLSLSATYHLKAGVKTYNGSTGALLKEARYDDSHDVVLAAGNELALSDRLTLSSGLSAVHIRRNIDVRFSDRANTSPFPDAYDYRNWSFAPRLGLSWKASPQLQLFTNASRSIDPPSSWSSSGSGVTSNYAKTLFEQRANTLEAGLRGQSGVFSGSLALYRSWIKGELLNTVVIPATQSAAAVTSTFNSSPTIHQGIEAGLDAQLWRGERAGQVVLRQAYTLNDFRYRDDPTFGSNRLPGLPRHVYQAELQWQHPCGFYAGLNVNAASRNAIDYANTLWAPSYTVWGAKLGWEARDKSWQVFVDAKNLTDKAYATAISPLYNVRGVDSAAIYPGDGRSVFAGFAFRL